MAKLQQGDPKHIYLLAGEENYYIEKAQQRILARLFPDEQEIGDALQKLNGTIDSDDLISLIDTAPFFTSKNVLLIKNPAIFRETRKGAAEESGKKEPSWDKKMERLLAALADMPSHTYVIFVSSEKADKRRKIYKTVEKYGAVLEAEAIRAWNINDWLQGKLQSMNREQIEASRMDGANYLQQLRYLYIPHLGRSFAVVVMIETIFLLSVFAEIFTTTGGGPGDASTNIAFLIFKQALLNFDAGVASAGALFAVVLANIAGIFLIRMVGKNLDK